MMARVGLDQIVDFPTRGNNILDFVMTNRPSLVSRCEGSPGLSDHDVVFLDMNACAMRQKPARRKIYLWKHANFDKMRAESSTWTKEFISRYSPETPIELFS